MGTVKERSSKTGVSSGQVKDRFEQTTEMSDMRMTLREGGSGRDGTAPKGRQGNGRGTTSGATAAA
ncbi:hypothetical protein GCM10011583_01950 [Streptomyces camponoticapitis]|uniref:Uncharacterized protein n=1 Tax=Streptomyces camponoticapitis TaxID=1616125 RepID=A0ABQ2DUT5_9ACTN|nr:hypothetical protein GCM10011583_01950 [Streptomyces camponoticapitis]